MAVQLVLLYWILPHVLLLAVLLIICQVGFNWVIRVINAHVRHIRLDIVLNAHVREIQDILNIFVVRKDQ